MTLDIFQQVGLLKVGHPSALIDQRYHYPIEVAVKCCNWGVNGESWDAPKYKDRTPAKKHGIPSDLLVPNVHDSTLERHTAMFLLLFFQGHIWQLFVDSPWFVEVVGASKFMLYIPDQWSWYWPASTSKPVPWSTLPLAMRTSSAIGHGAAGSKVSMSCGPHGTWELHQESTYAGHLTVPLFRKQGWLKELHCYSWGLKSQHFSAMWSIPLRKSRYDPVTAGSQQ